MRSAYGARQGNYVQYLELEEDDTGETSELLPGASPVAKTKKSNLTLSMVAVAIMLVVTTMMMYSGVLKPRLSTSSSFIKTGVNSKPNVIFVLTDDVGYSSLGFVEEKLSFATPHITALAKKGIVLSNYYTQEVCTPGRASLLTGKLPVSIGMQYAEVMATFNYSMSTSEVVLPEVLKQGGYTNYAIGKWNLGHQNPRYLPTARGFDYFLGYMDGHTHYWSKMNPDMTTVKDFMYSDRLCYSAYDGSDLLDYSTSLYSAKAVKVIEAHDYQSSPMFMFLAYQAAHDPFNDLAEHDGGLTAADVGPDRYAAALAYAPGNKRQQYVMALMLLDDGIKQVYTALEKTGQLDNTYLVITSDNGGNVFSGARNGDLRGSKGSLFEGGVRVDAMVYSPLLSKYSPRTYDGLFHVSDWFQTVLSWTGVSHTPSSYQDLDGVSQAAALAGEAEPPRQYVYYNSYANVFDTWDKWAVNYTSSPWAIRDARYKLIHAYVNFSFSSWTANEEVQLDDDQLTQLATGAQKDSFLYGNYSRMLFDLKDDPNETKNLYGLAELSHIQKNLYDKYFSVRVRYSPHVDTVSGSVAYMKENGLFIQPFQFDELDEGKPQACQSKHVLAPDS